MTLELLRTRYDALTAGLEPPFAFVDLDAFDANAADLVRRAKGKPIRVATKSVRVRWLLERVLARPGFKGLMCYALAEAHWLFSSGLCGDLLVAYPSADRSALRALAADAAAREAITLMVDSVEHLDFIAATLGANHPTIRVCLELDASWRPLRSAAVHVGARRSPVFSPADAVALARAVLARPGFRLVGVMAYEAQIAGVGDRPPGRPVLARMLGWMQRRSSDELARRRGEAIAAVKALAPLEFVNGGGTGSVESTAADPSVTEIAAGSGLIGPTLFDAYSRFHPRPALLFALPVVRRPTPGIATLFAGGYVASGSAGKDRLPTPYLPEGLRLLGTEGAGEVQTPVAGAPARTLRIGDRVWLRPAKAGELAERFERYHLVSQDGRVVSVSTYRGEGRCFG